MSPACSLLPRFSFLIPARAQYLAGRWADAQKLLTDCLQNHPACSDVCASSHFPLIPPSFLQSLPFSSPPLKHNHRHHAGLPQLQHFLALPLSKFLSSRPSLFVRSPSLLPPPSEISVGIIEAWAQDGAVTPETRSVTDVCEGETSGWRGCSRCRRIAPPPSFSFLGGCRVFT